MFDADVFFEWSPPVGSQRLTRCVVIRCGMVPWWLKKHISVEHALFVLNQSLTSSNRYVIRHKNNNSRGEILCAWRISWRDGGHNLWGVSPHCVRTQRLTRCVLCHPIRHVDHKISPLVWLFTVNLRMEEIRVEENEWLKDKQNDLILIKTCLHCEQ